MTPEQRPAEHTERRERYELLPDNQQQLLNEMRAKRQGYTAQKKGHGHKKNRHQQSAPSEDDQNG